MQKELNYENFQELTTDELNQVEAGFDWYDVLDFIIRSTVVIL